MIKEMKTIKLTSKRQISIPRSFDLLKEGDSAYIKVENNRVIIEPIRNSEELAVEMGALSQRALSECWDSKEDEKAFSYLQ